MKGLIVSLVSASLAIVVVACSYSKLKEKAVICDQQYALCTSAQCVPDPTHPGRSICFCEVKKGLSYGYLKCKERKPRVDQYEIINLISTFSMDDFKSQKNMTCPSGNPWSNCLDQPCVIDPFDPQKAICLCKIMKTGVFQTFGGNCDTSTCKKGLWSAAQPEANDFAVKAMMEALGFKKSPQKFCSK